jgi:hypothetical protein
MELFDNLLSLKGEDSYGVSLVFARSLRRVLGLSALPQLLISPRALLSGYPPVVRLRSFENTLKTKPTATATPSQATGLALPNPVRKTRTLSLR